MRTAIAIAWCALLGACASSQSVTLLPRGDAQRGTGTLDRMNNELRVAVGDRTYSGKMIMKTSSSSYGAMRVSSDASALLIGDAGQMRCEFSWDALMTSATGVCTDNKSAAYDLLIQN